VTAQQGNVTGLQRLKLFIEKGQNQLSTADCKSTACGQASDAKGSQY